MKILYHALLKGINMKNIMALTIAVASVLTLSACGGGGGGGDNSAPTPQSPQIRADEGIWNTPSDPSLLPMQAVILDDGSYWGLYGTKYNPDDGTFFSIDLILHGAASISGNNASGAYTIFTNGYASSPDYFYGTGTYSGAALAQNNLSLTFNDPTFDNMLVKNFSMNYDSIYKQPIPLAQIEGNYLPGGYIFQTCPSSADTCSFPRPDNPSLTISGSSLTLYDGNGAVAMTGTIAPHGTTVNVFDVSLATSNANPIASVPAGETFGISVPLSGTPPSYIYNVPAGTVFNGILFQTSAGQPSNYIEIIAASKDSIFYFLGNRQD